MEHCFNEEYKAVAMQVCEKDHCMLKCRDMTDIARKEQELLDKVIEGTNEPASTQNFTSFLYCRQETVWEDPRGADPDST